MREREGEKEASKTTSHWLGAGAGAGAGTEAVLERSRSNRSEDRWNRRAGIVLGFEIVFISKHIHSHILAEEGN